MISSDNPDKIISSLESISQIFSKMYELRQEQITKRRKEAQNNPITKRRKSEAMKAWHAKKKEEAIQKKKDEEYQIANPYEGCTCFLGNPPCSFCTDSNYCEECDIKTWDSECPKCNKNIERE
jgi:hypothetical protein